MPLYLDTHIDLKGLTDEKIAEAHKKDKECEGKYGVNYINYWYNPEAGTVFCLVEGPSKEACNDVHREAHGMVAEEILEVKQGV